MQVKLYLLFPIYCNFQIQWHVMKKYIWKCSHRVSCVITSSCQLTLYNIQAHNEQHEEQHLFSSGPCKLILTNHHQYTVRGTIDHWSPSKYIYFLSRSLFMKIAINILQNICFDLHFNGIEISYFPFTFQCQWDISIMSNIHIYISIKACRHCCSVYIGHCKQIQTNNFISEVVVRDLFSCCIGNCFVGRWDKQIQTNTNLYQG
jgi:hypothetical protein